jgi:hypothetical protein
MTVLTQKQIPPVIKRISIQEHIFINVNQSAALSGIADTIALTNKESR